MFNLRTAHMNLNAAISDRMFNEGCPPRSPRSRRHLPRLTPVKVNSTAPNLRKG